MAELFKNVYNKNFFDQIIPHLEQTTSFDRKGFYEILFDKDWELKELKERMRHITTSLGRCLTQDYHQNVETIYKWLNNLKAAGIKESSVEFMFIPDFIEYFGLDYFDTSVQAFPIITTFTSCEFAVRPFILRYPEKMVVHLNKWSKSKNLHVRRLASEGSRSRLPWAMAIPAFKSDPSPIIPILDRLKDDESEYVRRSVANNLNDVSKDNPEMVIKLAKSWKGNNKNLDWVVKHACRTLLKAGNSEVLSLFGFAPPNQIQITDFKVLNPIVEYGKHLPFNFILENKAKEVVLIRLEYAIYFLKANGSLAKKVFKISEKKYASLSKNQVERKHPIKPITTRKYYNGKHQVALILNGVEQQKFDFELKGV